MTRPLVRLSSLVVLILIADAPMININNISYAESYRSDLAQILGELFQHQKASAGVTEPTLNLAQLWKDFENSVVAATNWLSGVFSQADRPFSTSSDPPPPFAFNGAYANYSIKIGEYGNQSLSLGYGYSISNVNSLAQTFSVTFGISFSGLFGLNSSVIPSFNQTSPATFTNPSPFPAVSPADLTLMNQGKIPPDLPAKSVTPSQTISVPAGTFLTDAVQLQASSYSYGGISETSSTTTWYDMNSGVIVEASNVVVSQYSQTPENEVLQGTNIPMSSTSTNLTTSAPPTGCSKSSIPLSGQTAYSDDFSQDAANPNLPSVNTALWSVNSPVLSQIAGKESTAFGENVEVGNLGLPVGYSRCGINWVVEGADMISAMTTQAPFTPPFTAQVVATPNPIGMPGRDGGNPVAIILSNKDASIMFAVYLGTSQVCVDSSGAAPTCGSEVNLNEQYTVLLDVNSSQVTATVLGSDGETPYVVTAHMAPSSDFALYLSIGTFAGEIPGETSYSSYADSAIFTSATVRSSFTYDLAVDIQDRIGGTGQQQASEGASMNVTNVMTRNSHIGTTVNGRVVFSDLVTGLYVITAGQSGTLANGTNLFVSTTNTTSLGNPSDPSSRSVEFGMTIVTPPIQSLVVNLNTANSTIGISPLEIFFSANPTGGPGHYQFSWSVSCESACSPGQITGLPSSSDTALIGFQYAGVYKVTATVSSGGKWFGAEIPTESITSTPITVMGEDANFFAVIKSLNQNNKINLKYNYTYQGELYYQSGNTYLNTTVTNDIAGINISKDLQSILGISFPYYAFDISDNYGTQAGQGFTQPEESQFLSAEFPPGTPAPKNLQNYLFTIKLNPINVVAIIADIIVAILAVAGVLDALSSDSGVIKFIIGTLISLDRDEIGSLVQDLLTASPAKIADAVATFLVDAFWAIVQSLQYVVPAILSHFTRLANVASVVSDHLSSFLTNFFIVKAVADVIFDVLALLGAVIGGVLQNNVQDFSFTDVVPGKVFSVSTTDGSASGESANDPPASLPYVEVSGQGLSATGWDGGWVGTPGSFVHSSIVGGTYSFSVPLLNNYMIEITAPPGVVTASYNLTIYTNGTASSHVSGVVGASQVKEYMVTSNNTGETVTQLSTTTSSQGPGGLPFNLAPYAYALLAIVITIIVAAYLLSRRRESIGGPSGFKTCPQCGTLASVSAKYCRRCGATLS